MNICRIVPVRPAMATLLRERRPERLSAVRARATRRRFLSKRLDLHLVVECQPSTVHDVRHTHLVDDDTGKTGIKGLPVLDNTPTYADLGVTK